jgi:integrase
LTAVRGFARYLQALDARHEVPPTRLLPIRRARPVPHLFTQADIDALMTAARQLTPAGWAATVETMIGLLWVTGMRVGEVIALDTIDVNTDEAVLTVWFSKFNKSRHVPVTASTITALTRYRQDTAPGGPALFAGPDGNRVHYPHFKRVFDRLVDIVGITTTTGRRPRVHDLRHSFATRTLTGWYRTGIDVHAMLPQLSTYLGHVDPVSTYWYLTATPELMALAATRLEAVRS